MAWANLVRSTSMAVSSGSKICSKQSGNYAKIRAAVHYKVMLQTQTQTPPIYMMRVRTFSGGVNNCLCNMVNNRSHHDFHSTTIASSSATSVEKAASPPPILPMGEDMFEIFTDKAKQVIKFAQMETRPFGYKFVGTEMILLGLIGDGTDKFVGECTDIAEMVLFSINIRLKYARRTVREIFGCSGPPSLSVSVDQIPFRASALRAFQLALAEAQELGHNYMGSEHLLLGLLGDEDANILLEELGASPTEIRIQVMRMIKERAARVVGDGSSGDEMPTLEEEYGCNLTDEKKSHPFVQGNNKMPNLWYEDFMAFGDNLTEQARQKWYWKPVVERKALINTLIQILGRRSENNAFLVGEKGVGKASVLLGLVQRIRDLDVPNELSNKKVIGLSEVAHFKKARYYLQDLMEEVEECNDIIIYINDENSNLLEHDIDSFVDIMMPAVAKGGVQCVISATPDEYLRMKKYPKFMRLFQPINVPAATVDETIEILKGIQKSLERTHNVRYTDEALVAAVHMSDQFLRHGFQPVNAINLMDSTGAFVYKKEIHQVRDQLEVGHKMSMSQIKENIKLMPLAVTKADIEEVASEVLRLSVMINQVFGVDKSYNELFEVLADMD